MKLGDTTTGVAAAGRRSAAVTAGRDEGPAVVLMGMKREVDVADTETRILLRRIH